MQEIDEKQRKQQQKRLENNLSKIKNVFLVISGKGGVGKTTTAVNIAYGLAEKGFKVGLMDIDIHGPNIAKMLGAERKKPASSGNSIIPVQILPSLKAMSISFLMENQDKPLVWRGPLKMGLIKQFLSDVKWDELDYLIVDSPPGTGDEPLTVCQLIPEIKGAIVVTTPQGVATLDARKSINFAKELKIPVTGVIENMSGLVCPHCKRNIDIFGSGGGEDIAKRFRVPFLGKIPLEPELVKTGDVGIPFISLKKESVAKNYLDQILTRIISGTKNNE